MVSIIRDNLVVGQLMQMTMLDWPKMAQIHLEFRIYILKMFGIMFHSSNSMILFRCIRVIWTRSLPECVNMSFSGITVTQTQHYLFIYFLLLLLFRFVLDQTTIVRRETCERILMFIRSSRHWMWSGAHLRSLPLRFPFRIIVKFNFDFALAECWCFFNTAA